MCYLQSFKLLKFLILYFLLYTPYKLKIWHWFSSSNHVHVQTFFMNWKFFNLYCLKCLHCFYLIKAKCCGWYGPKDYTGDIPGACYADEANKTGLYDRGCKEFVFTYFYYIGGVGIAILLLEVGPMLVFLDFLCF